MPKKNIAGATMAQVTMYLIICFLLGSLHRRKVRASVIVDREQGGSSTAN